MAVLDLRPENGSILDRLLRLGFIYDHEETRTVEEGEPDTDQVWMRYEISARAEFSGEAGPVTFTDTDTRLSKTVSVEELKTISSVITWRSKNGAPGSVSPNTPGDGDGWWIILLALLFGWGRNGAFGGGYGSGNGSCCAPATCAGLQAGFNNQSVNTMLNGINSGICSLGYDVASQINGVNTNIMQNSYNTANAITQAQFAQQQSAAALQAQLADCCCQNREAISGVNYNMATSTNAVTTAISNAARDITENQNTNYRQLHDELVAYRMEDKDNTIAELRSQVNALNLSASQSNQNAYLVAQLKTPAPVPAYTVPNPNGYYGCQQNCYQSCGC